MLYFDKQYDGWRIAVWHVTETIEELLAMLPDEESIRTEAESRFGSASRILEWTAVRVLLYDLLDRQVPILYHDNGAPYLPEYEHLDISISHTRGYVAVALAEQGEIGIDIEQISAKVERVRNRFVRDDEVADTLEQLLLHWSAKETAFKKSTLLRLRILKAVSQDLLLSALPCLMYRAGHENIQHPLSPPALRSYIRQQVNLSRRIKAAWFSRSFRWASPPLPVSRRNIYEQYPLSQP